MNLKVTKKFLIYAVAWLVIFAMFCAITFIIPDFFKKTETSYEPVYDENGTLIETKEVEKVIASRYKSPVFWVAFVLAILSFIGQLACAFFALGEEKSFFGLPLIYTSAGALIATAIICSICMVVYKWLGWFGIIVCILTFGFSAISVIGAKMAGSSVSEVDKKIKTKTMYIKMLTADAQTTVAKAESDEMKKIATKVYEAVRYSDPMSDPALQAVEEKITEKFGEFDSAVAGGDVEAAEATSKALIILITERNTKCKILK